MDLDAAWMDGDFASDVFETMRVQEETLPRFPVEKLMPRRREVINWMIQVSEGICYRSQRYALDARTVHLAVYLFDHYLHSRGPPKESAYLIAAAALVLAAKYEEEGKLTTIGTAAILSILPNVQKRDLRITEQSILAAVGFRLLVPTAVSYVPYFIKESDYAGERDEIAMDFSRTTGKSNGRPQSSSYYYVPELYFTDEERRKPRFWNCEFFDSLVYCLCKLTLKYAVYWKYKPSEIAASAVTAARFCINAAPTWPSSMATLTKYSLSDLCNCVHQILLDFDRERRQKPRFFPALVARSDFATAWTCGSKTVLPATMSSIPPQEERAPSPVVFDPALPPPPLTMDPTMACSARVSQPIQLQPALLLYFPLPTGERVPVVVPLQTNGIDSGGLGLLAAIASATPPLDENENRCTKKARAERM